MNILILSITIIILLPVCIFAFEVFCAIFPQRKPLALEMQIRPSITVLIPAHNESGTIHHTLLNIKKQLDIHDRLVVVADNCSDNTASIARKYNAEVLERFDETNRGKGYALDYGVMHIKNDPTQVVIIIDADCQIAEGGLEILGKMAIVQKRPIQSLYIMNYINPGIKQRISEFAWLVKNYVRPRGLFNIGMPCQLMGTGMAFPWEIIANAKLATSNIVEDMKMGLDMATVGYAPVFCPSVRVTSTFPEAELAEKSQKKRWEHGHLSILTTVLPGSILCALKQRSLYLFVMSMDLIVPPLALLGILVSILFVTTFINALITKSLIPFVICAIAFLLYSGSVLLAWFLWGRRIVSFIDLLKVPLYMLSKIPLYVTFLFKRQKEWVRTDRD